MYLRQKKKLKLLLYAQPFGAQRCPKMGFHLVCKKPVHTHWVIYLDREAWASPETSQNGCLETYCREHTQEKNKNKKTPPQQTKRKIKTVLCDLEIARTKQQRESHRTKAELPTWNSCFKVMSIFVLLWNQKNPNQKLLASREDLRTGCEMHPTIANRHDNRASTQGKNPAWPVAPQTRGTVCDWTMSCGRSRILWLKVGYPKLLEVNG